MSTSVMATMTVRVACVAQLRDRLGQSEFSLSLPQGATGREFMQCLSERSAGLEPLLKVCRLAVNGEYAPLDVMLHDGDEVVMIPPVSGG